MKRPLVVAAVVAAACLAGAWTARGVVVQRRLDAALARADAELAAHAHVLRLERDALRLRAGLERDLERLAALAQERLPAPPPAVALPAAASQVPAGTTWNPLRMRSAIAAREQAIAERVRELDRARRIEANRDELTLVVARLRAMRSELNDRLALD